MSEPTIHVTLTADRVERSMRSDVHTGLSAEQKWLPPRWLYDARGSELFDEITRLPEYYPTRVERGILTANADAIAQVTGATTMIELGSGSSEKARILLDAFTRTGTLAEYVPVDVSESALREAAGQIATEYPALQVSGVVDDFTETLAVAPTERPRLVAFLGSTIGNLVPDERAKFLESVRVALDPGDWLLLGTDLVKDRDVLLLAYDDPAGVTAEFNLNVLRVLNRELAANFPLDAFGHRAIWDPVNEWIEMRLEATREVDVGIGAIDLRVHFRAGEQLRTEVSSKFRRDGVAAELESAGFAAQRWWTDPDGRYAVSLGQLTAG